MMQQRRGPKGVARCQVPLCAEQPPGQGFYKRYRICVTHCSMPSVEVNGAIARFCNLCRRFQPLDDFEGERKSCRMKLAEHNARRYQKRVRVAHEGPASPGPLAASPSLPSPSCGSPCGGGGTFAGAKRARGGGCIGGMVPAELRLTAVGSCPIPLALPAAPSVFVELGVEAVELQQAGLTDTDWAEMLDLLDAELATDSPAPAPASPVPVKEEPQQQEQPAAPASSERAVMLQPEGHCGTPAAEDSWLWEESPFAQLSVQGAQPSLPPSLQQQCAVLSPYTPLPQPQPQPLGPAASCPALLGTGKPAAAPLAAAPSVPAWDAPCPVDRRCPLGTRDSTTSCLDDDSLDDCLDWLNANGDLWVPEALPAHPSLPLASQPPSSKPAQQQEQEQLPGSPGSLPATSQLSPFGCFAAAAPSPVPATPSMGAQGSLLCELQSLPTTDLQDRLTTMSQQLFGLPPEELPVGLRTAISHMVA